VNTIKCNHEGCVAILESDIPLAADAKYTCRLHTPKSPEIHFQEYQFDQSIPRTKKA